MKPRLFFYAILLGKYILTGSDINEFYEHFHKVVEAPILISLGIFGLVIEFLVMSPNVIKNISLKYRKRVQLTIHIALAINTVFWMIYDKKSIENTVFFIIVFSAYFIIGHKLLHAIYTENEENKNQK